MSFRRKEVCKMIIYNLTCSFICVSNSLNNVIGVTMLGLVKSCIGTKFTSQFGDLIAVSIFLSIFFCLQ